MESFRYLQDSRKGGAPLKSWGEQQIARLLERNNIDYFYEHPLAVMDEGKTRIWYPDFQLPHYGMLIEYFGMSDDPVYAAGMKKKKTVYEANDLTALLLTPDVFRRDWPNEILSSIQEILTDRLTDLYMARNSSPQAEVRAGFGVGNS